MEKQVTDNNRPWFEEDGFWEDVESLIFGKKRIEVAGDEVSQLIKLFDLDPSMRVLDMCCGVGRHALEFARRRFDVTGVDRTERYINRASARASDDNLDIRFVCEDIRRFCEPESYDIVLNMFTSFGYFEDPAEDRVAGLNLFKSLKKDGVLIMDSIGKEIIARIFHARDWHEHEDGTIILEERRTANDWSWMENRWIIFRDGRRFERFFCHRPFSASELKTLLLDIGFSTAKAYGDLEGSPYDHRAKRLIIEARK